MTKLRKLLTVAICISLSGCSSYREALIQDQQERTKQYEAYVAKREKAAQEAAEIRARPYNEVMTQIRLFRNESGCDTPTVQKIDQLLSPMEIKSIATTMVYSTSVSYMREAIEFRNYHTNAVLTYADTALKKKCLDLADRQYRHIIDIYTGAAYGGVRDRARIGLDDIREARRAR